MPNRSNTRPRLPVQQSRSSPLSRSLSCSLHWRPLYWLLALSLSLQSIAPTALAANAAMDYDAGVTSGMSGIWTISCAGKPMWLPIPNRVAQIDDAAQIDDKPEHKNGPRHCLICNNLAGFEVLSATSVHLNFTASDKPVSYSSSNNSTTASQVRKACHCRAPPIFLRS